MPALRVQGSPSQTLTLDHEASLLLILQSLAGYHANALSALC